MQKKRIAALLCAGVLIMLTACSTVQNKQATINLPGGGTFALLPPAALLRSVVATQRVQGRFKQQDFVLLAQLEIDKNHLAMVGATPAGNMLFSVSYRDGAFTIERSSWLPEQLQPAYMLADLQLIFWPLAPVERQLAAAGFTIKENQTNGKRIRSVYRDGQLFIEIQYEHRDAWQGPVRYENKQWQYTYTIETVQAQAL